MYPQTSSNPISDKLPSYPSLKIVSSKNVRLTINEEIVTKVIEYWHSISNEIPVTLLSILGTPSNEKNLVTKSLIECCGNVMSGSGSEVLLSTGTSTWNDLSTSAVYLINQPFYLTLDNGTRTAVWILHLHQGEGGRDDIDVLQKFMLLISSRITEVKFDKENFRMLKNWKDLEATFDKPSFTPSLCDSFLYVFSSESENLSCDKSLPLTTFKIAKRELSDRIKESLGYRDATVIGKLRDVSVIKMKSLKNPLYYGSIYQTLINSIEELHKVSKPNPKVDQYGNVIRLGGLSTFIQHCVNRLNGITPAPSSSKTHSTSYDDYLPQAKTNYTKDPAINLNAPMSPTHRSTILLPNNYSEHVTAAPILKQKVFDNQGRQNSFETNLDQMTPLEVDRDEERKLKELEQNLGDMTIGASSKTGFYQQPTLINEEALARNLIKELVQSYNAEMKRFLKKDVYAPEALAMIHAILKNDLSTEFLNIFNFSKEELRKLETKLTSTLDKAFPPHRQQNTQNLKTKQANISKCIQKTVSHYMVSIENVLRQNPNGLANSELERTQAQIVDDVKLMLESEVKQVREQEPMEGHLKSLMAEVNEYWEESVKERNEGNIKAWEESGRGNVTSQQESRHGEVPRQETKIRGQTAAPDNIPDSRLHNRTAEAYQIRIEARQSLYDKIVEIEAQLKAGNVFNFKSRENKDHFVATMRSACSYAEHPGSTFEQIQEQMKIVESWTSHFRKQ